MNAFSRSLEIAKLSLSVIGKDRELLLFPILGGIFSLLYTAAISVPAFLYLRPLENGASENDALLYGGLFVLYFGLAFLATFFNTCVVYTTKTRFEGGDASFGESIGFAFSRLHLIFAWSLLSASVGMLLRALDRIAERSGALGQVVLGIVTSLLGLAWSVITIFVVPSMVYHGLGPLDAIKQSVAVLKRTWGESLIRHYGLGILQALFVIVGVVAFGFLLVSVGGGSLAIVVAVVAAVYFVALFTVFSLMNTIFNTALYVYADSGQLPSGFTRDVMANAIGPK